MSKKQSGYVPKEGEFAEAVDSIINGFTLDKYLLSLLQAFCEPDNTSAKFRRKLSMAKGRLSAANTHLLAAKKLLTKPK